MTTASGRAAGRASGPRDAGGDLSETQARIIAYSRVAGWLLCGVALMIVVFAVVDFRHDLRAKRAFDRVRTVTFVEKVRACRRAAPKPTPSWQDCERRVRESE
jgi:hypothetical protein